MNLNEMFAITESRSAPLYHAIKRDYAIETLTKNRLLGTSIQRFSPDGRILPDPDFKYSFGWRMAFRKHPEEMKKDHPEIYADFERWENSEWYVGVSLTRSKQFAIEWSGIGIVLELDQAKLAQRYKLLPWNWGSSKNRYKKEQEEFLVLGRTDRPNDAFNREKLIKSDESNPKVSNLDQYLLGIYLISSSKYAIFDEKEMEFIKNHPKYKGEIDKK